MKLKDRAEDSILASVVAAIAVTEAQIAEFEAKLDVYDEATIRALNENHIRLDQISQRLIDIDLADSATAGPSLCDGRW